MTFMERVVKIGPTTAPDVILFTVQVILIFVVVCVSLVNLSLEWGNQNLWTVVLTGSLGYIMPNPKIKVINGNVTSTREGTATPT
jgi:hypothetical protein